MIKIFFKVVEATSDFQKAVSDFIKEAQTAYPELEVKDVATVPFTGRNTILKLTMEDDSVVNHAKGAFATAEALRAAYPVGVLGDWAIVGTTDTMWVWDVETVDWVDTGMGAILNWGGIGGDLEDQTDLQNALNAKFNLDQSTEQEIANGVPKLLAENGNISDRYHLVNKDYIDKRTRGGGGFLANVYFRTDNSDQPVEGTKYKRIDYVSEASETELSVTVNSGSGELLVRTYLYDGALETTLLDAGIYCANYRAKVDKTNGVTQIGFQAFVRTAAGAETTLFTAWSAQLTNTGYLTLRNETNQPYFVVNATDRFGVRIYARTTHSSNVKITTVVGGEHASYFSTPIALRHNLFRGRDASGAHPASSITETTDKRFVSDTEKGVWNGKQNALGFTPENSANKGSANGYCGLGANSRVSMANSNINLLSKEQFNELPEISAGRIEDIGSIWSKIEMGASLEVVHAICNIGNGIALCGAGFTAGDGDIYRTDDYGLTWTKVFDGGADVKYVQCIEYVGNGIVLAGTYSSSGKNEADIYISTDYGLNWTKVYETGAGVLLIDCIKYVGGGVVYASAGTEVAGPALLYKSTDYGANWTPEVHTFEGKQISDMCYLGNNVLLFGTGYSEGEGFIYRSSDKGATWDKITLGASVDRVFNFVDLGSGVVLAGVGTSTGDGDIYKSIDYGLNWAKVEMGASLTVIYALSYIGNGVVLCGGGGSTGNGDVYRSVDYGDNWTKVEMGAGLENIRSICYLGRTVVLAGAGNSAGDGDIYRSVGTEPIADLHNNMNGIQGGTTDEYYHMTANEKEWLSTGSSVTGEFTGFASPEDVVVSYDSGSGKVTLTGTVTAYWKGLQIDAIVSGWESPVLTDTYPTPNTGYFLYYNGSNFVWSSDAWTFDMLQIAYVYYTSAGVFVFGHRETHGLQQWQSHRDIHYSIGTRKVSGGTLDPTSYTLASETADNRRPSVLEGVIADEDLYSTISPLLKASEKYTRIHLTGNPAVMNFTVDSDDIVPLSGGLPQYNQNNAGTWQLTALPNNQYMCVFLIEFPATADATSQKKRFVWMPSQTFGALSAMQSLDANSLVLSTLAGLAPEFVFSQKVIIRRTGNSSGNWTIHEVINLTGSKVLTVQQSGSFLTAVTTDESLTGSGTPASPLSVNKAITTTEQVDSYVLALADNYTMVDFNKGTALTCTVPKNSVVAFPIGSLITVRQTGDGQLTIAPVDGDVTLQYPDGLKISKKYGMATLLKTAVNTWAVTGMLVA